ncbi:hypothetical protein [Blautia marasmi]|uniref:hypothetical protein n=1 Tax=Blautia marasmi TaxID=1917868 RepID=UPI000CF25640|nr:hypothetical protein [Blautia marasmi]
MKILRAFQVINKDGVRTISSTYNEVDKEGNITNRNVKDSFYAVNSELKAHVDAIEEYINNRLAGE